jgi:hypothetical protein
MCNKSFDDLKYEGNCLVHSSSESGTLSYALDVSSWSTNCFTVMPTARTVSVYLCTSCFNSSSWVLLMWLQSTNILNHFQVALPASSSNLSKAIPVTGRGGCEMLRIPRCLDSRLTYGGEVVSPMHQPHFTPQKHYFSASGTHFC